MPRECVPDAVQVDGALVVVGGREAGHMAKGGSLSGLLGGLTDRNEVKTFDNR
jgi:hypothetical protein